MSPSALSPVLMPIPLDGLTPADARKRVAAARVLCRGLFQGRDVTNPSADGNGMQANLLHFFDNRNPS